MKKYISFGAIVLLVVLFFAFQSSTKKDGDIITVGIIAPLSGPVADVGEYVLNGWKLAMQDYPEIARKKIHLLVEDDACDPKKAVTAAQKLIESDHVHILVSAVCSGSSVAIAPIAEAKKVILFTPISTSPKLTNAGEYVFRASGTAVQTALAAVRGVEQMKLFRIAILFENAEYAVGWKDSFIEGLKTVPDASVLGIEGVGSKDTDLKTQITKLAALKPDAIIAVMNSGPTASNAIKQIRELGITVPVIGNEYFTHPLVLTNPAAEGIYATMYTYERNTSSYISFMKKYTEAYGGQSLGGFEIYPMLAYDGARVLLDAISACGNDNAECVKEKLYAVKEYQGVSGVITIDDHGDTLRNYRLVHITKGDFLPVQ